MIRRAQSPPPPSPTVSSFSASQLNLPNSSQLNLSNSLPHKRSAGALSARSSSSHTHSFVSSSATTSTLPEYSHDAREFELVLDATDGGTKDKECNGKCLRSCLSALVIPTEIDESPPYTTPLRPPPRSPSITFRSTLSLALPPCLPEAPEPRSETPSNTSGSQEPTSESEDDFQDSSFDSFDSIQPPRIRNKPPTLLIRSTLPRIKPDTPCSCADPLCPGGELDRAYDAPLPCTCGLPDCQGGDVALSWKLRADGLRKSGRVRHVKDRSIAIKSEKKHRLSWGYKGSHV